MTEHDQVEKRSERWLIDAGRRLDPPQSDIDRLTRSVIESARKLSHPRVMLNTDTARVIVTDRVVRRLLLIGIRRVLARPVLEVVVTSTGGEITGVRLGIVCYYDDLLDELGDRTRGLVADVLVDVLGAERGVRAAGDVDIDWVDLDESHRRGVEPLRGTEPDE